MRRFPPNPLLYTLFILCWGKLPSRQVASLTCAIGSKRRVVNEHGAVRQAGLRVPSQVGGALRRARVPSRGTMR